VPRTSTAAPSWAPVVQEPQAESAPARGQLLQPGIPGLGGGDLRDHRHELRRTRARGDPLPPRHGPHRVLLPGAASRETVPPPATSPSGAPSPRSQGRPAPGSGGPPEGRYVPFRPFYVKGPAYGGLVGGVEEAARFVRLHLNGGQAEGTRLLSEESVAEMQRLVPRGGKRDFGLGWFRSHRDGKAASGLRRAPRAAGPASGT
jgi:hypothetical protein